MNMFSSLVPHALGRSRIHSSNIPECSRPQPHRFVDEADIHAPIFTAYTKSFKAMVSETNPSVLDKGLDCLLAFCDKSDQVFEVATELMKDLINKGFASSSLFRMRILPA